MIKLTATALIHYISPVIQVTEKFQKRELILDDGWEKDGIVHPNYVLIEFSGDKMAQLDSFYPGQRVTVEAFINGREHNGRYFNSIRGMSVTLYQPAQATSAMTYPQAPIGQNEYASASAYPHRPSYPQHGGLYQQAAYPQMNEPQRAGNLGPENLPFM